MRGARWKRERREEVTSRKMCGTGFGGFFSPEFGFAGVDRADQPNALKKHLLNNTQKPFLNSLF